MKSPIDIYLVFDLETTGLSKDKNAICEIACCPFDNYLNNLKEFDSGIIKPYLNKEIRAEALEANGITMEQLNNGRDAKEVLNELINYIRSFKKSASKIVLVGHNISKFDVPFLEVFFKEFKKDLFKYVSDKLEIDTMWWGRIKWVESQNYKLGTCCENCEIELINAHRAISDTRANRDLMKAFISSLRGENVTEKKEDIKRPIFQF